MAKKKRSKYIPVYHEWAKKLSGNNLLVYAYIAHAIEISRYEIDLNNGCSIPFATISREEIAHYWSINTASVSRSIAYLKDDYYIVPFRDHDNHRKYNYILVPFQYELSARKEWANC